MDNKIRDLLDLALTRYSTNEHLSELLEAKKQYVSLTGKFDEDDPDFESRMNCFNDWYLFNYQRFGNGHTTIDDFILQHPIDSSLENGIRTLTYSLFDFVKINFQRQLVLYDVLHDKKIYLSKDKNLFALVEKDLFSGRIIHYGNDAYLTTGICSFPFDLKSSIIKEAKKLRKLKNTFKELSFLLSLESMKARWKIYKKIDFREVFLP